MDVRRYDWEFYLWLLVGGWNDDTLSVSRIPFANDTLIFCRVAPYNLRYLRCVILCLKLFQG
jgi:hypothetical protein